MDDLKALSAELRDSLRSLEKRHTTLEEAAGLADADLRDHLIKQGATFNSELTRTSERLSTELDRITSQLQADKLDASALVSGLTELAGRIAPVSAQGKKQART